MSDHHHPPLFPLSNADTGWAFNRYNSATQQSESWTTPGGWSDCDPRFRGTFTLPAVGPITSTIPLDAALVTEWLKDNGANNYGILIRATSGFARVLSGSMNSNGQQPTLSITYWT